MAIGAIIGGIGAAAGGAAGAFASAEAADTNWKINLLNYYQRERERKEAMRLADEIRREQKKGGVDAAGNRTYFDPIQGWVTELSPEQQNIFDLQQLEQQNVLSKDLPAKRAQMQRNERRQIRDGSIAEGSLLRALNQRSVRPEELASVMRNAAARANSTVFNELSAEAATKAVQRGTSNAADVLGDIGKSSAQSLAAAMSQAELQAAGTAEGMTDRRRRGNLAEYGDLANMASKPLDVQYAPQNVTGGPDNRAVQFAQLGQGGNSGALSAAMRQGGTMDYIEPDFGLANAIGGGANAIGSSITASQQMSAQQKANDLMNQYLQAGMFGGSYGTGGALSSAMRSRVAAGNGVF